MPPLERKHLKELHCIQPLTNVESIFELGILSHERAKAVKHDSIAREDIQDRRAKVTIPGTGRKLHTYANLYINGRNKMMFWLVRHVDGPGHEKLCVLRVSLDVLDLDGVIICDRNASADLPKFAPSPAGLVNIDKDSVLTQSWYHDDPMEKQRRGSLICAEVLVPDVVLPKYITGAYASCENSVDEVLEVAPDGFKVQLKKGVFFE